MTSFTARFTFFVLLAAGSMGIFPASFCQAEPMPTLIILNWAEYLDPGLIKEFESRHKVRVREVYYETETGMDQMLAATGGKGYDLVVASRTKIMSYVKRGWLAEVDRSKIPNLRYLDPRWEKENPEVSKYSVPYFWGTVGIAYRKDLYHGTVTGWKDLFRPAEPLRGRIMMIEDVRDTVGMALKALGYSLNSTDSAELAAAEKLLLEQRPFVRKYGYLTLDDDSDLLTGKYWMAMMYNGDALVLADKNDQVVFVQPEEGTNIWLDSLAVLAASKQRELAFTFIDFLNIPENAARNAEHLYMATPNLEALKHTSEEYRSDENIFPPPEVLQKSEFYQPLPPRVLKRYNAIFTKASYGLL